MLCLFYLNNDFFYKSIKYKVYVNKITIIVMVLVPSLLILLLLLVQIIFSSFSFTRDPQLTVLESGFERLKSRIVLSSSFFSLVALFVLFDIELILLFPGVLFHFFLRLNSGFFYFFLFLVILITLIFEWVWFGLKWQT